MNSDFRDVNAQVHFWEKNKTRRVTYIDTDAFPLEKGMVTGPRLVFRLIPTRATRHIEIEAVGCKPTKALDHWLPSSGTADVFVFFLREMINGYPDCQGVTVALAQRQKVFTPIMKWSHSIGENEDTETTGQTLLDHRQQIFIHERLAASERYFLDRIPFDSDFIEEGYYMGQAEILQVVVGGARIHIAVLAGYVAQTTGVEPNGMEPRERDQRTLLPLRGHERVLEFRRTLWKGLEN